MRFPLFAIIGGLATLAPADSLTVAGSIAVPPGYTRVSYPEGSYSRFLQDLPVKGDRTIHAFDGSVIRGFDVLSVLDMPLLFKQDLEQCADFAMRLWAEYHKRGNTLANLYLFDYNGKKRSFPQSGLSYPAFLRKSFANSNSHSIKVGAKPVASEKELVPGDMLVQNENGGIGHVSVVMDVCEAPGKPRLYLIGFSYMPAQEFHIQKASMTEGLDGWFTLSGFKQLLSEILPYGPPVYRRFGE